MNSPAKPPTGEHKQTLRTLLRLPLEKRQRLAQLELQRRASEKTAYYLGEPRVSLCGAGSPVRRADRDLTAVPV